MVNLQGPARPDASAVLTPSLASGTVQLPFRALGLRDLPVSIVIFLNTWSHGTQIGFGITKHVVKDMHSNTIHTMHVVNLELLSLPKAGTASLHHGA